MTSLDHDDRRLAETYDRLSDSQFESGKRLVARLGIAAGSRVLDVGCGTGRLTRYVAEVVAGTGRVVGIDPLAERIAIAREKAPGVAFEVARAEDLGAFGDGSFDAVTMSAVFHWIDDKARALAEVRRVLRPGGVLGITTIPGELRAAGTIASTLAPILRRPPYEGRVAAADRDPDSRFPTTTDLVARILDAGLELTELHVASRRWGRKDGAEVVDFLDSSSFGNFLRIVPEELRASLRADLAAGFDARKTEDGVVVRDWGARIVATRFG